MGRFVDLTGNQYGDLTVVGRGENYVSPKGYRAVNWLCKCKCGNVTLVRGCNLKSGATTSCGCKRVEHPNRTTHGDSNTRLYSIWKGISVRCYNKNDVSYMLYGGRGITMCAEWHEYEPFRDWALANGYTDGLSIDRIDFNGDYEPNNCRWATAMEQANNTRRNHMLTYHGETRTMAEWSRITGIKYYKLKDRINKCGWDVERALETP